MFNFQPGVRLIALKLTVGYFPLEALGGLLLRHWAAELLPLARELVKPRYDPFPCIHAAKVRIIFGTAKTFSNFFSQDCTILHPSPAGRISQAPCCRELRRGGESRPRSVRGRYPNFRAGVCVRVLRPRPSPSAPAIFFFVLLLLMCAVVCAAVCAAVCVVFCVVDASQTPCISAFRCVVGCVVSCAADCAAGCAVAASATRSAPRRRASAAASAASAIGGGARRRASAAASAAHAAGLADGRRPRHQGAGRARLATAGC